MSDFKIVKLLDPVVSLVTNVKPRGAYSAVTTYGIGDAVSFGNSSYIAIQPTTGNVPTDTAYWQLLASSSTNKLSTIARNLTGSTIPKGSVVYFSGASGNLPTLALAQANSELTSARTIGITAVSIANNADGEVVVVGLADSLDTAAFPAGASLWLSPTVPGGMTTTKPVAPNNMVFVGFCTRSHPTDGTIEIKVQNGFELEELHNVLITSVANNQVLAYESSSSLWKNKTFTKTDVGLGNVDNTSDLNKPISTAVQTALDGKFNNPTGTNVQYIAGDGSILNFPAVPTGTKIVATVINGTASTIDAFRPVYIIGSSGGIPTIGLGSSSGFTTNRIIGFTTTSVAAGATTSIVIFGLIENVNTSAFAAGETLYLSSTGIRLTVTKPTTNVVILGTVGKSDATTGTFLLNLIHPLQLVDMSGVLITSPVTGHSLVYDAAAVRWINRNLTKSEVGLSNVDNTSDINKPVSTAQQLAIDSKVVDAINNGVTTSAPSQNAVFDALGGKQNSLGFTPENVANKVVDLSTIDDTVYPSLQLVNNSFVRKTGDEMTGTLLNNSNLGLITDNFRTYNSNSEGGACSSYEDKDGAFLKIGMTGILFSPVDLISSNSGFIKSSQEFSIDAENEIRIGIEGTQVAKFNNTQFTANKIDALPIAITELGTDEPKTTDELMFFGVDELTNFKTTFSELPISTKVQDALDTKEDTVASGTSSQYYRGDKTFQDLVISALGQSGASSGQVPTWNGSTWVPQTPTGGGGGGAINLDGGFPDSTYGAVSPIDGGSP